MKAREDQGRYTVYSRIYTAALFKTGVIQDRPENLTTYIAHKVIQ